MKVSITGTIDGQVWPERGGEIELPDHLASDLVANGYADPVEKAAKAAKVEAASVDPVVETATVKPARARKSAPEA